MPGEILSYYSLGPKNYVVTSLKDNQIQTITKVSGLSLTSVTNNDLLNENLFKYYIDQHLNNIKEKCKVKQYRIRGNFKKLKVSSNIETVTFTNSISSRRYLPQILDLNHTTFPYGFI